jgi:hypothetical protein
MKVQVINRLSAFVALIGDNSKAILKLILPR